MSPLSESTHAGAFLISENGGNASRSTVTIASGSGVLPPGAVLGQITANGKWAPFNVMATDGTQNARGVLFARVDATSVDVKAVAITSGAEVESTELHWANADPVHIGIAESGLRTRGIKVR